MIDFFVHGKPFPDQRPRVARNGGIIPNQNVIEWKELVERVGLRYMTVMAPLLEPVELKLVFHMPIPESWSRKRRDDAAGTAHAKKPDVDNLAKAVMDALNGVVWQDDAQVTSLNVRKVYAREVIGVQLYANIDLWG